MSKRAVSPEPIPASDAALLLRSTVVQVPGSRVMFTAARLLRQGMDPETVVIMTCLLLDLTDPDIDALVKVLRSLPPLDDEQ